MALAILLLSLPARAQTAPATLPVAAPAASAATRPAIPKAPKPTTDVSAKSCTTAQCHPEVKDYKFIHGPVNVDACDACHKLTDAATHTYELSRPKQQICTFCHKMDAPAEGADVHQPVKTGDCLPCHNPHGGKTAQFFRGDTMRQMCATCHQDVIGAKKFVHGPVAAGACEACHLPHVSKYPKLLVAPAKDLCLTCHREMADQLKAAKVTHKPVMDGDCAACHDPHASDYKMQVKADPFTLCTSCHEHDKIKQAATDAKDKHSIVTQGQACLNCHTAHGGPLNQLLKAQPVDICLTCHKNDQKTSDGRVVKSVAEIADPRLVKHGPIKEGTCSGCHDVHGSDIKPLLTKAYPDTFYAKFDPNNFALCFSCHDQKLVETKEAEGLTGFRNGIQNLHYVHVDKEKGRTCRACHETHASANPVHLRDAVPYGQWALPINYKKTATGGSCAPGCHKEYAYDRAHPVDNGDGAPPATLNPATAPVTDSAPAATSAPAAPTGTFSAGTPPAAAPGVLNLPR